MRTLRVTSLLLASVFYSALSWASINTPNHLALGLGPSIPGGLLNPEYRDGVGASRATNGEIVTLDFAGPKMISNIRLTAFSSSRAGRVLIRDVRASLIEPNKTVETRLVELFDYNKNTGNGCGNHGGLCMLADSGFTASSPNDRFNQITFRIEGFQHGDSSLLIEMDSADGIAYQEFILKRTGASSTDGMIGGFIDEVHYSSLNPREVRALMRFGRQPMIADLVGRSYVCTIYSKNRPTRVDYKTRQYFSTSPGLLESTSDHDPNVQHWILTQQGWKLPFKLRTGCGDILHSNVLRMTSTGNLISEVDLDRQEYVNACVSMGYSYEGAVRGLENGTFPSLIASRYAAGAYEFCRPARL